MADPVKNIQWAILSAINDMKFFGVTPEEHYEWLKPIAIRFYSHRLRGFNMPSVKAAKMTVDGGNAFWAWPPDYIRYTKIAYAIGNRIWTLGIDPTINLAAQPSSCGTIAEAESSGVSEGGYYFAYYDSGVPLYSMGGGFNENYYKVNSEKGYIQFVDALPAGGTAVIEYLSSGENVNEGTLVPPAYMEAFVTFLKWQICSCLPKLLAMEGKYKKEYDDLLWDSNILAKAPTTDEVQDMMMRAMGFSINRYAPN